MSTQPPHVSPPTHVAKNQQNDHIHGKSKISMIPGRPPKFFIYSFTYFWRVGVGVIPQMDNRCLVAYNPNMDYPSKLGLMVGSPPKRRNNGLLFINLSKLANNQS